MAREGSTNPHTQEDGRDIPRQDAPDAEQISEVCWYDGYPIDPAEVHTRTYAGTGHMCAECYGRREKRQCDLESFR